MRMLKRAKKSVVCAALCACMIAGSGLSASAASGTTYSYSNLKLSWSTSASSASATLTSGTTARLGVHVEGNAYSGTTKKGNFSASKVNAGGVSVSCSAKRNGSTIKNGYAEGSRNYDAQTIFASIYY